MQTTNPIDHAPLAVEGPTPAERASQALSAAHLAVAPRTTVARAIVNALEALGVSHAFGVMGGAISSTFRALATSNLRCVHFRHESGAAFAAVEASLVSGRPVVVFTTAGPGITNALTGLLAGRWDGARVVLITACTSARHRGRAATQETSAATLGGAGLFLDGGAFHYATVLEHAAQLPSVVARLAAGFARPGGLIAHVSLPIDVQQALVAHSPAPPVFGPTTGVSRELARQHAELLTRERPAMWLGFGARHAAAAITRLAERTGALVLSSPRGKGILPEDHPQFVGVTGLGGHPDVDELLAAQRPAYTLVLGTRMGESTSFWADELTPRETFIHVDADAAAIGAAFPDVPTIPVVADVGTYVEAVLDALDELDLQPARAHPPPKPLSPPPALTPHARGLVRPQLLLQEVQRRLVDTELAWIAAESGNAFCWATHLLRFRSPGRYRVSTGFGSMGHATTGVVGAALARRGKAVALVGDGAMMMQNELHTAVQERAPAVWVVLNDACYQMCAQGMQMLGWEPLGCELPPVDFVALARAVGADGVRVEREVDVGAALEAALAAEGPFVVDVAIDPREVPPSGRRNRSLLQQGADAEGAR